MKNMEWVWVRPPPLSLGIFSHIIPFFVSDNVPKLEEMEEHTFLEMVALAL